MALDHLPDLLGQERVGDGPNVRRSLRGFVGRILKLLMTRLEGVGALLTGIEMVIRQMQEALGRFGVSRIEAVGKPFDPTLHEAMSVVETDDVPENQIIEEFQAGYLLHDRIVRPARVGIAKRVSEERRDVPPPGD